MYNPATNRKIANVVKAFQRRDQHNSIEVVRRDLHIVSDGLPAPTDDYKVLQIQSGQWVQDFVRSSP